MRITIEITNEAAWPDLSRALGALADFVADVDLTDEELDEALRADGVDPSSAVDQVLARARAVVRPEEDR